MKIYLNGPDAISDLHRHGFTNDFQLFGNKLLWIEEKVFISAAEFSILECHKIIEPDRSLDELVVFGIIAPYHDIKGILINHYKSYTTITPPVIARKLRELIISACVDYTGQVVYQKK